jgi:hypothetical protein
MIEKNPTLSAFVKMDEFHAIFLLIQGGKPVDWMSMRRPDCRRMAFFVAGYIDRLGLLPENVYCEGAGWATPLKSSLKRLGVIISEVTGYPALRDADFEIGQEYHIHSLREAAKALQEIEYRTVKA